MSPRLAIVIPAFKDEFLGECLKSISNQTCKEFTLYICDDCSPCNIYKIVEQCCLGIHYRYIRFDENMGQYDLAGHWNRCVSQVADAEWVWLFSDDDVMDSHCVEQFFYYLNKRNGADLFHFNVNRIDDSSTIISEEPVFPEFQSVREFCLSRMAFRINSYVVEYVFRLSAFQNAGGFECFELAWESDFATWIKIASHKGIVSIAGPRVYWRNSGRNISSYLDVDTLERKIKASLSFHAWLLQFFHLMNIGEPLTRFQTYVWFLKQIRCYLPHTGVRWALKWASVFTVTEKSFFFKGMFSVDIMLYYIYIKLFARR